MSTPTIGTVLQTALESVFPAVVFPNVYAGDEEEYIVWNYSTIPEVHADGAPRAARYLVQVHYYLPHGKNPSASLVALDEALAAAGFTWPDLTNATDDEGQHYVLGCEYCDGGAYYGLA